MSEFDLVVVGAATAGFEAAVAARRHGAERVAIFEKAPFEEAGGNARFSHTGFRFPYADADEIRTFLPGLEEAEFDRLVFAPYSSADFLRDIERLSEGEADPGMSRTLAEGANGAMHWLREVGIEWALNRSTPGPDGKRYFPRGMALQAGGGSGGGMKQLAAWRRIAAELGITVFYDAPVRGLERGPDHGLIVRVEMGTEPVRAVSARNVVLASGGFQASRRRRTERLGPAGEHMIVRGSRHNTGEVMDYAFELGAVRSGAWDGANVSPVDGSIGERELGNRANRYSYPYGITVNSLGERFFDEGEGSHSYTYAKFGWALAEQPSAAGYQIFDSRTYPLLKHYAYEHATPAVAESIGDLALQLSIPVTALEQTVADFNAAVPSAPPFDPTAEDGRRTTGLDVPKSNWAVPIEAPPYYGYSVTSGITFTYGGLKVDEHSRVLDEQNDPIEGLYASGDILGIFSKNYPSGSGQTRNAVFSLAAGRHIGHGHSKVRD